MIITGAELQLALISAGIGAVFGAIGGAFGVTMALRQTVQDIKDNHGNRLIRVETRVGITPEGTLTGNGLIGTLSFVTRRMDFRNQQQHPEFEDN